MPVYQHVGATLGEHEIRIVYETRFAWFTEPDRAPCRERLLSRLVHAAVLLDVEGALDDDNPDFATFLVAKETALDRKGRVVVHYPHGH